MLKVFINKKGAGEPLDWENLTAEDIGALASTPTLFGGSRTFVLTGALAGERSEEFFNFADALAESPHTFILVEEKLLKGPRTAVEKAGGSIEEGKVIKREYRFDQFGAAQALQTRDRKGLWLAIVYALRAGEKPEALAGLLAWKARAMGDSALSRTLTFMYHDSHRGVGDLELLLERFALTL
jgi:DNA polymerase III delta subunit